MHPGYLVPGIHGPGGGHGGDDAAGHGGQHAKAIHDAIEGIRSVDPGGTAPGAPRSLC